MEPMQKIVIAATVLCIISFGGTALILLDSIANASIPDVERGVVVEKQMPNLVVLDNGKTLTVFNHTELFNSIEKGDTYVFDCRIDFNNHRILVEYAKLA